MSNRHSRSSLGRLRDDCSDEPHSAIYRETESSSRPGSSPNENYDFSIQSGNINSSAASNVIPGRASLQSDQRTPRESGYNTFLESPRRRPFHDPSPHLTSHRSNGSYHGEKLPSLGEMLSNGSHFSPPQSNSTSQSPSWMDPSGVGRSSPREYPPNLNDPNRLSSFSTGSLHLGPARPAISSDVFAENTWDKTMRGPANLGAASYFAQNDKTLPQSVEVLPSRAGQSYFSHGYAGDKRPGSSSQSKHHATSYPESTNTPAPSDESVGDASSDTTLSRFVRQEVIPGEGLFFFYDDGSHCAAVIDGEPVNERWGVTKAGKPRRRLALACVTCRDKKIKCDPGDPKCAQCDKFGRECWTRPP